MRPWQRDLKTGDKILTLAPDMPIFHEVLEPQLILDPEHVFVRVFTKDYPDGAADPVWAPRDDVTCTLTDEEWDVFKQAGWEVNERSWSLVPKVELRIQAHMDEVEYDLGRAFAKSFMEDLKRKEKPK